MSSALIIHCKRIYEPPGSDDGLRVLVDRLWPRGVSRERGQVDWWFREIAPSTELRRWFSHDPERWDEFRRRYYRELDDRPQQVMEMLSRARQAGVVTLLYAARDEEHSHALVLRDYLQAHVPE